MRQAAVDIRYAFERDMVRRLGNKAFASNAGIIRECVECKQGFDRTVPNQVVCDDCRVERVRRQTRERVRKHRAHKVEPRYEFTMVDRDNLVAALIRACVVEAAQEGDIEWLEEFGEPYIAAIGEHVNMDRILEAIDEL